jgi:hypothetical protein
VPDSFPAACRLVHVLAPAIHQSGRLHILNHLCTGKAVITEFKLQIRKDPQGQAGLILTSRGCIN